MRVGNISSDDLQILLNYYPRLEQELKEAREIIPDNLDKFVGPNCIRPTWFQWYEKPIKEHIAGILSLTGSQDMLIELAAASNQIQAMPGIMQAHVQEIEDWELDEEEQELLRQLVPVHFSYALSFTLTLRSLMTFGLYLNELIAQVREGGKEADKALFRAVKIDPTVVSCSCVAQRISRAVMLNEQKFLGNLRRAINGKLTKREQRNYQDMRVVLQVLHEANAPKLSQDDLYRLFVEELKLVAKDRNGDSGDVANNLRQFAYQFMKQKSVS